LSCWSPRRIAESSPCSGPRTAALPPRRRRCRLRDPPRRRPPCVRIHEPAPSTSRVKLKRQISSWRDGMRTTRLPDLRVPPPPSTRPLAPPNQSQAFTSSRACSKLSCTPSARSASSGYRRRRGPPPVAVGSPPISAPNLFRASGGVAWRWRTAAPLCAGAVYRIFSWILFVFADERAGAGAGAGPGVGVRRSIQSGGGGGSSHATPPSKIIEAISKGTARRARAKPAV
jgi:hypothetical protein